MKEIVIKRPAPTLKEAFVWLNGMVMVFDHKGKQMPQFQGHKEVALPLIYKWIDEHPDVLVTIHYNAMWPKGKLHEHGQRHRV